MNPLQELENFINEFNSNNDEAFAIDSIRVEFSKEAKKKKLDELGTWKKLKKNSNILHKLKKRLSKDEITSAYRLEKENIYYYNHSAPPHYRKATLVIFGLKQYHKAPTCKSIVSKIVSILKDITSIDLCLDIPYKPNIEALHQYLTLKQFITKDGVFTDTHYINNTGVLMIDKIVIYDKAFKNKLDFPVWRIEALIVIPNIKYLALPLHEFKEITDIAKGRL